MEFLKVMLLHPNATLPARETAGSVGYDISACLAETVVIEPGETKMIGAGFSIALDPGFAAFIYARSGLGIKHGIVPANCVGVIDSDYRGEVIVGLKNTSDVPFSVSCGDRIAQMVIARCELPTVKVFKSLDVTERGGGGFGSTGGWG
ncbi:MAG: dUTP diphosphatase, partial [Oscillospiraceae bacterium]|nr:dUTP diphosphatase [Oscillospiraceae bacterium]